VFGEQDAFALGDQLGVDVEHRRQDLGSPNFGLASTHMIGMPVGVHTRYGGRPQKKLAEERLRHR
jgi:hypothetical protein